MGCAFQTITNQHRCDGEEAEQRESAHRLNISVRRGLSMQLDTLGARAVCVLLTRLRVLSGDLSVICRSAGR